MYHFCICRFNNFSGHLLKQTMYSVTFLSLFPSPHFSVYPPEVIPSTSDSEERDEIKDDGELREVRKENEECKYDDAIGETTTSTTPNPSVPQKPSAFMIALNRSSSSVFLPSLTQFGKVNSICSDLVFICDTNEDQYSLCVCTNSIPSSASARANSLR